MKKRQIYGVFVAKIFLGWHQGERGVSGVWGLGWGAPSDTLIDKTGCQLRSGSGNIRAMFGTRQDSCHHQTHCCHGLPRPSAIDVRFKQQKVISHSLGGWKSKTRVLVI